LIFTIGGTAVAQQMSDEQVMQYVLQERSQGTSQQQMMTELLQRGVTREQVERIKANYENGKYGNSSDNEKESSLQGKGNRTRSANKDVDTKDKTASSKTKNKSTTLGGVKNKTDLFGGEYASSSSFFEDMIKELSKKKIFGRSIFSNQNLSFEPSMNIATPVDYRLGPGDEVIIDIWGASQNSIRETISPDGTIQITNLGPVYLSGMTIKEARRYLETAFSKIYKGISSSNPVSQISLALGQIRSIQINIMGEVEVPGTYTLSSFASVFHALYKAGGVNDIGTMRAVKVYRNNKLISTLDIYEYILEGKMRGDIRLMDGDVIVVSPYDCLVNVTGKVKRPMFYEMKGTESVGTLLKYAGGFMGDAYTKNVRLVRKSGREHQIYNVEEFDFNMFRVMDGDSLSVDTVLARFSNRVEIKGAVYRPGMYQMDGKINSVKELINKAEGVRGDAFLNRAVLHRQKEDYNLEVISINLKALLNGDIPDIPLHKEDRLFIPSIRDLQEEKTVTIYGEIINPGIFPYAEKTSLEDLILNSGGLKESASTVRVDVSRRIKNTKSINSTDTIAKTYSFALKNGFVVDGMPGFTLEPFDQVYVRRSPGYQKQQNILIEGEVLFAGTYALTAKNQRLSSIVARTGGLTKEAYAVGARLERIMTPEEKLRMRTAMRMAAGAGKDSISIKTLDMDTTYYVGIELEKAIAKPGGNSDLVLREGDRIIVPQFTNTVKINGAVMYPNTVTYMDGKKLKYYIDMAGGFGARAKKKNAYVIYMNGTVARLRARSRNAI
ncbi:MAG: SLBB domain-containing protein, partial [Bacteroidaceae bacterium]